MKKFITFLSLNIFLLFFQSISNYPSDVIMRRYSTKERILVVRWYFECHKSISVTQLSYRRHFHTRNALSKNTIQGIVNRFQEQGAVCDLSRSGRPRTARTVENQRELEQSLEENRFVSTRRRSQQMGVSRSSLQRMLHKMDMLPNQIQLVQQLEPQDYEQRLEYAISGIFSWLKQIDFLPGFAPILVDSQQFLPYEVFQILRDHKLHPAPENG